MSPIVAGYGWRMLWDTQYGPINQLLGWLLGRPLTLVWLINSKTVYFSLIVTEVWQWTPFMFLALLAGLVAISPEIHEAAAIDGAGRWQRFWQITLPLIRPLMLVALLIRALDVFKIFDTVFSLTFGGPGTFTETITLYVYLLGFRNFRLGYTAAVAHAVIVARSSLPWRSAWSRSRRPPCSAASATSRGRRPCRTPAPPGRGPGGRPSCTGTRSPTSWWRSRSRFSCSRSSGCSAWR